MLQEAVRWNGCDGRQIGQHTYYAHPESEVGIFLPKNQQVLFRGQGENWIGITTANFTFVSAHAHEVRQRRSGDINPAQLGRYSKMRREIDFFWQAVPKPSQMIVGIDFNTTPIPGREPHVGQHTHPPMPSHDMPSRNRLHEFVEHFELQIPHTFQQVDEHWTREQGDKRSQIDFLMTPVSLEAHELKVHRSIRKTWDRIIA